MDKSSSDLAFLERKRKIIQRVRESHANKKSYELYIDEEIVDAENNGMPPPPSPEPLLPPEEKEVEQPLRRSMTFKHGMTADNMGSPYQPMYEPTDDEPTKDEPTNNEPINDEPTLKQIKSNYQKKMREHLWKEALKKE